MKNNLKVEKTTGLKSENQTEVLESVNCWESPKKVFEMVQVCGAKSKILDILNTVLSNTGASLYLRKEEGMNKVSNVLDSLNGLDIRTNHLLGKKRQGLQLSEELSQGRVGFDYVREVFIDLYELSFFVVYENTVKSTKELWAKVLSNYPKLNWWITLQEEDVNEFRSIREVYIMEGLFNKQAISHFSSTQIEDIKKKHPNYYRGVKYLELELELERENIQLGILKFHQNLMDENPLLKSEHPDIWSNLIVRISQQEQRIQGLIDTIESIHTRKDLSYLQDMPSTGYHSK